MDKLNVWTNLSLPHSKVTDRKEGEKKGRKEGRSYKETERGRDRMKPEMKDTAKHFLHEHLTYGLLRTSVNNCLSSPVRVTSRSQELWLLQSVLQMAAPQHTIP